MNSERFYNLFSHSYFTHPASVCLNYFQHFRFSFGLGVKFAIGSVQAFIHAIYPDVFTTSSSDLIEDVTEEMKQVGCDK